MAEQEPPSSSGEGQCGYAILVVAAGIDELGRGGGTKGLARQIGEYLAGGLAGRTPFFNGE
jgi:hypothetical protein